MIEDLESNIAALKIFDHIFLGLFSTCGVDTKILLRSFHFFPQYAYVEREGSHHWVTLIYA